MLAAGRAERLGGRLLKGLVDVAGEPLVGRLCRQLFSLGMSVNVVTGHRADEVEAGLAAYPVRFLRNPVSGSGLSWSFGVGLGDGEDGVLFVLGDTVTEVGLLRRVAGTDGELVLGVIRVPLDAESMKVRVEEGRPTAIGKDLPLDVGYELTGVVAVRGRGVARLRQAIAAHPVTADVCHGPIRQLLGTDLHCVAVDCTGFRWIEIDFPEDVQRMRTLFPGSESSDTP